MFDRAGALVGLVASAPDPQRQVAGVVPLATYDLLSVADVSRVSGRDLRPNDERRELSAADLIEAVGSAIVPVECVLQTATDSNAAPGRD